METLKLRKFMRRIYKKNRNRRIPVRAMMELTYTCNHKCIHCYNPIERSKAKLSKEEVFSCVDQLADMGTLQIAFTGGEIFTRPDIMDIIFHTRKRGLRVALLTNGSLIKEDIADKLISWGVSNFEISFLGATEKTFEKMTRVKGSFKRVTATIKMLRQKGIIPQIKTCVTNINLEEVDKIADLAKTLGASFSYSPLVIPRLDLGQEPGNFRIEPEEFLDIRKRFIKLSNEERHKRYQRYKRKKREEQPGFWEKEYLFNCMAGHTVAFINPYGLMKACMTVPEPCYDIRELGVRECWERIKKFVDTLQMPLNWECFACEYNAWCSWCPGRGYLNTGNIFGCPPYFKELAKARKERYEKRRRAREV